MLFMEAISVKEEYKWKIRVMMRKQKSKKCLWWVLKLKQWQQCVTVLNSMSGSGHNVSNWEPKNEFKYNQFNSGRLIHLITKSPTICHAIRLIEIYIAYFLFFRLHETVYEIFILKDFFLFCLQQIDINHLLVFPWEYLHVKPLVVENETFIL